MSRHSHIEVYRRDGGSWVVAIDGQVISDHASHVAARTAAQNHLPAEGSQTDGK